MVKPMVKQLQALVRARGAADSGSAVRASRAEPFLRAQVAAHGLPARLSHPAQRPRPIEKSDEGPELLNPQAESS